jgi:hypothetical protein
LSIENFDLSNKQTFKVSVTNKNKFEKNQNSHKNIKSNILINNIFNVDDNFHKLNQFKYLGEFEIIKDKNI